ncbi:MAG: 8-oxo-dGTP diphosphatase [Clostridia bacterium]|nr:8-oxo-dGTP diphosphatase [Clostridia bacterium]
MKLATLCYIGKGDQTLMMLRNKKENDVHEGKWNGLGGKMEKGETPEECVIREVKEESGLIIKHPVLNGILTFPEFSHGEDWMAFVFTAREFEGELSACKEGELHWIDNDDILNLNLWEGDRIFMKWLDTGRFFSGKFVYKDGRLIDHHVVFYS